MGVRVTCYGGRNREYTFDRYLGHLAEYFDADIPYVDVNDIRPGTKEIVRDIFGYRQQGVRDGVAFGEIYATGYRPRVLEKLKAMGVELSGELFREGVLSEEGPLSECIG